jgi:hypothetical protein
VALALNRYVFVSAVTIPAGTPAAPVAGEPETGGAAGHGSVATTGGPLFATTCQAGQAIVLDPAGALYGLIGAANLRPFVDGQDTRGGAALSN